MKKVIHKCFVWLSALWANPVPDQPGVYRVELTKEEMDADVVQIIIKK